MAHSNNQSLIIYTAQLLNIGGIETFIRNFCRGLKDHYQITFVYGKADPAALAEIATHVSCVKLSGQKLTADILILGSAWGTSHTGLINAPIQIQTVHADYLAFEKEFGFKYIKAPGTTHHVAVSKHVARQFEKVTPYKIDKVIYNLL